MRLIVALALLLVMSPGGTELVELTAHIIAHGDLPHHDDVDDDCAEHTCTPLRHQCGCHSGMSAVTAARQPSPRLSSEAIVTSIEVTSIAGSRASEPPPLRPPIG